MPQENYDGFKAGFYAAKLGVRVRTLITQTLIRLVVFESMLIGIATFIGVFGDHLYNRLFQCGRWIC